MPTHITRATPIIIAAAGIALAFGLGRASAVRSASVEPKNGSTIEHDSVVATAQAGPHNGGGQTTGYSFFTKSKDLPMVFRKRALHRGSSIGLHTQMEDEVYYVLSGQGELTLDGDRSTVGPGTAILTRTGSSHSIRPIGDKDLVLIITYPSGK
jgi:mannose-6-phosphate isomerase-like protein (cupin superfamily)